MLRICFVNFDAYTETLGIVASFRRCNCASSNATRQRQADTSHLSAFQASMPVGWHTCLLAGKAVESTQ